MRLTWDTIGSRQYQTGLDRGVFYPKTGPGVAWNGLTSINESDANVGEAVIYIDGQRVVNKLQLGDFAATVEAFIYPEEFEPYDGYSAPMFSGQKRDEFNLSYRTLLGNDVKHEAFGYRLHLIYNCSVKPSARDNVSLNADVDILNFSWDLTTRPEPFPYDRPTAHIYIDSPNVEPGALTSIENLLYGMDGVDPRFPTVAEILAIFEANAIITIVDHGDGSFTASGPDVNIFPTGDPTEWEFTWPNVIQVASDTFRVSSY